MANDILTSDVIARETSMVLAHKLGFGNSVRRRYDDQFAKKGAKIGSQFDIRIPPRYEVTRAVAMPTTIQDSEESRRSMKVDYAHVPLLFSDSELLLDINSFGDQFLKSAVAALANFIDLDGTALYKDIANIVGTTGSASPPSALSTYLKANAILTEEGTPEDGDRVVCLNANQNAHIIDALKGLYNPDDEISEQFKMAKMRKAAGLNWLSDQNMYLHTCGTRTNGAINGIPTTGDESIAIDGIGTTNTIKEGDVFTVAGVNAIDPQSRQSTLRLRNFVVTEDAVGVSGAVAALKIFPAMTSTGKDQTIDALPADDAVVTWNGSASKVGHQGLAYHPDAFALAMVDDALPDNVEFSSKTSPIDAQAWNISVSVIRDYDISKHNYPCRIGAYFGWLTARREMGCRVT